VGSSLNRERFMVVGWWRSLAEEMKGKREKVNCMDGLASAIDWNWNPIQRSAQAQAKAEASYHHHPIHLHHVQFLFTPFQLSKVTSLSPHSSWDLTNLSSYDYSLETTFTFMTKRILPKFIKEKKRKRRRRKGNTYFSLSFLFQPL